jgi:hypothetical protein
MRDITLRVCQGIGDIFWVYQKFSPYFDAINFTISSVGPNAAREQRAIPFLKVLPKIGNITVQPTTSDDYTRIAQGYFSMSNIMKKYGPRSKIFDYACNKPLEDGIRIEMIDPEYPIEETVPFPIEIMPLPFDNYLCLYVCADIKKEVPAKIHGLWEANKWAEVIQILCQKQKTKLPIVLVGAFYDLDVIVDLERSLKQMDFQTCVFVDLDFKNLFYVIKNSQFLVGYQSGINIITDNLDVPQLMIYFPILEKMMYTWAKKKNIDAGIFNAALFSQNHIDIAKNLKIPLPWPEDSEQFYTQSSFEALKKKAESLHLTFEVLRNN